MRYSLPFGFAIVLLGFAAACSSSDTTNPPAATGGSGGTATGGGAGQAQGGSSTGGSSTGGSSTGGSSTGGSSTGGSSTGGTGTGGGATGGTGGGETEAGIPDAPDDIAQIEGGSGACTNSADQAIIQNPATATAIQNCATQAFGDEAKTTECVSTQTGLSQACSKCFGAVASCTLKNCLTVCATAPTGPDCTQCRIDKCGPAFESCSGMAMQ